MMNELLEKLLTALDDNPYIKSTFNLSSSKFRADAVVFAEAEQLYDIRQDMNNDEIDYIATVLKESMKDKAIYFKIYIYSFLIYFSLDIKILQDFLLCLLQDDSLDKNTLYFTYYQIEHATFLNKCLESPDTTTLKWKLLNKIVSIFRLHSSCDYTPIPYEDRNHKLSIVITGQYLASRLHGPTRTALERAKTLKSHMGKEVLLINTAETLSFHGYTPFFMTSAPNYPDKLLQSNSQEWFGCEIPYFQCENIMPDSATMDLLINQLIQLKPESIISIGGSSVFASLANLIIPVLSIALCPSDLCTACTKYQTYFTSSPNSVTIDVLHNIGLSPKEHVIESIFPYTMRTQTTHFTKADFGIEDDKFVIAIAGGRLDYELKPDFLDMIQKIENDHIVYLLIGGYKNYEECLKKYPGLQKRLINAGFVDDILGLYEACDLYINPIRKGAGGTAIEALFKGIPVITTDYGDAAINSGSDFFVKDYEEMSKRIEMYYYNKAFYQSQSRKAIDRSKIITDADTLFAAAINEYIKRESAEFL